jgi:hypothetical protein
MLYTLSFSKNGQPLTDETGREITKQVEAESRSGAIYHAETVSFCETNQCTVRRVL